MSKRSRKRAAPPSNPPAQAPRARFERLNLTLEKLALTLAGGILLALPFVEPRLAPVHFLAVLPWTVLFAHPRYTAHSGYVLLGSFTYLFLSLRGMMAFHPAVPLALTILNFYAYLLFPLLLRTLRRTRLPFALMVPAIWVCTEWLRVFMSQQQLQMYFLGSSQFRWTRLIQVADLGGMAAVSFLVASVSGALADFIIPRSDGDRAFTLNRLRVTGLAVTACLFGGALLYGTFRITDEHLRTGPRIAVVQPNQGHYRTAEKNRDVLPNQIAFTRERIPPGASDMIVWPENAVPDDLNRRSDYQSALGDLAREKKSRLLVGAHTAISGDQKYTSAYLFSPEGAIIQRYDKIHMIFWSEWMPWNQTLRKWPALQALHYRTTKALLGWVGSGVPGRDVTLFELPAEGGSVRFATPICFEVTSSRLWRQAAQKGADFLVNMTSEGVLGRATYTHLLALSTFRAVENRMSVVRAANNGMSAFVDPNGRLQRLLQGVREGVFNGERGTMIDRVVVDSRRGTTFYSRAGDVFTLACAVFVVIIVSRPVLARVFSARKLAEKKAV